MSSNIELLKICQHCNNEFIAKTTVTKFCSHKCASRNYKKRMRDVKLKKATPIILNNSEFNQTQLQQKEFLSIIEACALLGASRMTIYRLIKSGKVKATKIGRRTIIKRSEIDKLF